MRSSLAGLQQLTKLSSMVWGSEAGSKLMPDDSVSSGVQLSGHNFWREWRVTTAAPRRCLGLSHAVAHAGCRRPISDLADGCLALCTLT